METLKTLGSKGRNKEEDKTKTREQSKSGEKDGVICGEMSGVIWNRPFDISLSSTPFNCHILVVKLTYLFLFSPRIGLCDASSRRQQTTNVSWNRPWNKLKKGDG